MPLALPDWGLDGGSAREEEKRDWRLFINPDFAAGCAAVPVPPSTGPALEADDGAAEDCLVLPIPMPRAGTDIPAALRRWIAPPPPPWLILGLEGVLARLGRLGGEGPVFRGGGFGGAGSVVAGARSKFEPTASAPCLRTGGGGGG